MIITPPNLNGLFTGFDTRFSEAYAKFVTEPWSPKFAMQMPSKTTTNVYAWLARLPKMREWLGPRIVQNLTTRSYTLPNKKFELTLGIQRDVIEDDQYDTYGTWMDLAAYEARKWPDTQVVQLLLQGDTANLGTCFDGQDYFDTDHPIDLTNPAAGVQTNLYTGKALNFVNFGAVRASMRSLVGEDGLPLGVNPNKLVVGPQLEGIANIIAKSDNTAAASIDSATGFVGAQMNPYKGTVEVEVIEELSAQPTAWYLMDTRKPVLPFIWQLRTAPEYVYRNQLTDEHVFNADEFLYGIRARGAAGFGLWFLAAKAIA